jgi:hypothetical protein
MQWTFSPSIAQPLRIQIRKFRKFLDPDPDPSINKQINEEKSLFLQFCDFLITCYLWRQMYLQ